MLCNSEIPVSTPAAEAPLLWLPWHRHCPCRCALSNSIGTRYEIYKILHNTWQLERWLQGCHMFAASKSCLHCYQRIVSFPQQWINSIKYLINWIPLRIRIRSRNTQPRLTLSKKVDPDPACDLWRMIYKLHKEDRVPVRDEVKLAFLVTARDCLSRGHRFDSSQSSKHRELKSTFENIELLAKLLDFFWRSDKSNVIQFNQKYLAWFCLWWIIFTKKRLAGAFFFKIKIFSLGHLISVSCLVYKLIGIEIDSNLNTQWSQGHNFLRKQWRKCQITNLLSELI